MYLDHFGMQELPFTLTPNTRFFLNLPSHEDAMNLLMVALAVGDGFVKVVGEVGTGKTMLCRALLNRLQDEGIETAYIPNPYLSPEALRRNFALEIGIKDALELQDYELVNRINEHLIGLARQEKQMVLVVDEAQAMPEETIEALRLLSNLETEADKLFQIVLFGQPELNTLLERPSLRQLKQRIVFSCYLDKLEPSAVEHYLETRAQKAGYQGLNLFTKEATQKIYKASDGTPRLVNILAHKSLICAYGLGDQQITPQHVSRAIADTESVEQPFWSSAWPLMLLAFLLGGTLLGLVLFVLQRGWL